jgi:mono/diheme cytochrome c family protein
VVVILLVSVPAIVLAIGQSRATRAAELRVERGKYLVTMIGCNDCHTPLKMGPKGPEPDMSRFLSGHPEQVGALPAVPSRGPWLWAGAATNTAFSGPWGISYAANLTPDQNTGLGIWTEETFLKALRTGRHMGVSREIAPPMPWPAYRHATDEDLKSIYAYLRTIRPVVNHVPAYEPPVAP